MPNFLIIGAPRAATTLLSRCAEEHPEIYMASMTKHGPGDVHFFDVNSKVSFAKNFDKGIEWYERLFSDVTDEIAVGEKTAQYLSDPKAPELIKKFIPDSRFVAVLRNPIDRAYSQYWFHVGEISRRVSFSKACFDQNFERLKLIDSGFYYDHISRYLLSFDREQFHFIVYEDFERDVCAALQQFFKFLNVDDNFVPSIANKRINAAMASKKTGYYLRLVSGLIKQNFPTVFRALRKLPLKNVIEEKIGRDSNTEQNKPLYPAMSDEDRKRLRGVFREQNEKLSELLSRDLTEIWN